jgi:ApaG protein
MATKGDAPKGLWVSVDRVEYVPGASGPPDRPHQFVYYITIHNDSPHAVTVTGRKWIVKNAQGHRTVIEGDGVVGQFPRLTPGDQFHYNSYHLVDSDSEAETPHPSDGDESEERKQGGGSVSIWEKGGVAALNRGPVCGDGCWAESEWITTAFSFLGIKYTY